MEEPGSSSGPSKKSVEKRQKFMLHVLSPSADVPNKITFPDVPVSATVGELKTKICNAVDSRPPPERQRLIYRGRPLLRDTATLKDIFTEETVRFKLFHWHPILLTILNRSSGQNIFLYIWSFPRPSLRSHQHFLRHQALVSQG